MAKDSDRSFFVFEAMFFVFVVLLASWPLLLGVVGNRLHFPVPGWKRVLILGGALAGSFWLCKLKGWAPIAWKTMQICLGLYLGWKALGQTYSDNPVFVLAGLGSVFSIVSGLEEGDSKESRRR